MPQKSPPVTQIDLSWEKLDQLDWQLWVVAIALIALLGVGVLTFMVPTAFWFDEALLLRSPQRAFYGLCVLLGLTLAYLLQKRIRLHELKKTFWAERERWQQQLLHNAFHDGLTDLPNRNLLLDRLRIVVASAERHKDQQFALIFVDLDDFKLLNDSMGHLAGDQALIAVARVLQNCVRTEDTVARLGGDEFAVLLVNLNEERGVLRVVERIRSALAVPLLLEEKEIFISASMGIATSTTGYQSAEDVLRDADIAMYTAKSQGTASQFAVFDASMHAHTVELLRMETELRRAVDRKEFLLHYQPIVWLPTGEVVGLEALIRWRHPERGIVPPGEFLPAIQAAGLMVPLTEWMLPEVCRQTQAWRQRWPLCWPMSVSVNLPAKYLSNVEQVTEITRAISDHGLPASKIRLEITENQLMEDIEPFRKALRDFSAYGTRVYIDDFGTGFSSLSYLSRFHVDALKIDQSFVRNLSGDERNLAIVRSVISLGHSLGLDVIAEGIETAEQLSYLLSLKCQYGQGYYFAKPLPPETVDQSLEKWFPEGRDKRGLVPRLGAFALFAGLNSEVLLEIAHTCEEVRIPPETVVIREGQIGDFVYLLEEGSIGIYKGESKRSTDTTHPFATLNAPVVFGEMALLNPEVVRAASVRALSELRALKFPIACGLTFLRRFPHLKSNVLGLAAERNPSARANAQRAPN